VFDDWTRTSASNTSPTRWWSSIALRRFGTFIDLGQEIGRSGPPRPSSQAVATNNGLIVEPGS
jgi:hypothetical protein